MAWLGLLLMAGSFVWLQLTAVPRSARGDPHEPAQPASFFALVVIDPGHGGQDPGTTKTGLVEKELTLDLAQRLERLLQERGLATLLTRGDDSYVSLRDRAAIANAQEECVFVSLHFDDAGRPAATGIETFYAAHPVSFPERVASWLPFLQRTSSEPPNIESQSLANFIQESLVAYTQAVNRGTRPEQFFVIANVRHPAVLVEVAFSQTRTTSPSWRTTNTGANGGGDQRRDCAIPRNLQQNERRSPWTSRGMNSGGGGRPNEIR